MNAQQLFLALEGIDEQYIQEAAEADKRPVTWRVIGAAAAVLAVALGAVWVSHQMTTPPGTGTQQTLSTPAVTAQPTAAVSGNAAVSEPPSAQPTENSVPENPDTNPPAQTETPPDETQAASSDSGDALHEAPYRAEYVHNAEGDFLVFTPQLPWDPNPPEVVDITGQLENGHFAANIPGLLAAQSRFVELQVHDDGSYDLYWDHDPFNDTPWWLETDAEAQP